MKKRVIPNVKKVKLRVNEIKEKKKISKEKEEYMRTYIEGFDALCPEGIPIGNSILVEGGPGNGKTIFCLNLVKTMCERGKKVLYMSFEEREERLIKHMESFGANPKEYQKKGLLYVKRFNALDIARSVEALLSEAKKELLIEVQPVLIPPEFKPDIVLIDSLSSISSAFSGESSRFRIYMEQLFRYLESHDITSFLIREVANPTHIGSTFVEEGEAVSFLSDGIIVLYNVFYKSGFRKRAIEFLKLRGANINRKLVECEIKKGKGIVVYPNRMLKGDYVLT
jgi:circadian clock protein KaiC